MAAVMIRASLYLAARYSRREELCVYREQLRRMGWRVTSRWLDGAHQISDAGLNAKLGEAGEALVEDDANQGGDVVELRARFAREDWTDLKAADVVVSFTEPPRTNNSRGGRHVEFGAALALGLHCIVVGPRENVFHCLPDVDVYDNWPDALSELGRLLVEHHQDRPRAPREAVPS